MKIADNEKHFIKPFFVDTGNKYLIVDALNTSTYLKIFLLLFLRPVSTRWILISWQASSTTQKLLLLMKGETTDSLPFTS